MTIFNRYGGGQIVNDAGAIENSQKILGESQGFDIVCESGACVLVVKSCGARGAQPEFASPVVRNARFGVRFESGCAA